MACEGPGVDKWLYSGTRVEAGVISVILVQRPPREGQVGPGGQRCSLRTLDPPPHPPLLSSRSECFLLHSETTTSM